MPDYQHFNDEEKRNLQAPMSLPTLEALKVRRLADVVHPCKPTIIVFKGGGVLGAGYPGFLAALEEEHLLEGVKIVAGSSAGGLVAILVALGYNASEIKKLMFELKFNELISEPHSGLFKKFINFCRGKLDPGTILRERIETYIVDKLGTPEVLNQLGLTDKDEIKNLTFAQLHALGKKDLYLTGTNKTGNNNTPKGETIFSYETTPNMRLKDAAQITASHPAVYMAPEYEGNHYTDGAVSIPFPMHFFNKTKFVPSGYTLTKDRLNPAVLGVAIETEYHIKKQWNPQTRRTFSQWLSHVFYECIFRPLAFFGLYNRKHDEVRTQYHTQIIQSYDLGVDQLDFAIDQETKEKLMEHAKLETTRYLRNYHSGAYLPDLTKSKSEQYNYTAFKNFQEKYDKLDIASIERVMQHELKPAIACYNDRPAPKEEHIAAGLALYEEEYRAAERALNRLKVASI